MKRKLAQTIDRREIDVSYLCPLGLIWLRDCSNCSFTVGHRKYANPRTAPAASSPFPPEVSALASTSENDEFFFRAHVFHMAHGCVSCASADTPLRVVQRENVRELLFSRAAVRGGDLRVWRVSKGHVSKCGCARESARVGMLESCTDIT